MGNSSHSWLQGAHCKIRKENECQKRVRADAESTGVLILTAYDDDLYLPAVNKSGTGEYVLKTSDSEDIVHAKKFVHEGKSALDPEITRQVVAQWLYP